MDLVLKNQLLKIQSAELKGIVSQKVLVHFQGD